MDAQGGRESRSGGSGRPGTWAPPAPSDEHSSTTDGPSGASGGSGDTPPSRTAQAGRAASASAVPAGSTASAPADPAAGNGAGGTGEASADTHAGGDAGSAAGGGGSDAAPDGTDDTRTGAPVDAPRPWALPDDPADPGTLPGGNGRYEAAAGAFSAMNGPAAPPIPPGTMGAAGPATPPPWGGPYGFDSPPPKRTNSGLVAALVAGGMLVVILIVLGVSTLGGARDDPKRISGEAAGQAGTALDTAPGLALDGTYAGGRARFDVTRAGSARGSYTSGGAQVGRVDIGGVTYLKAGSSFWTAQGVSSMRAGRAAGKWTKAPDFAVQLDLPDLSPARLAQVLKGAGDDPLAAKATVNGVPAIRMTAGGRTYYIAAKAPRRLLRIAGTTDAGPFSFDVTPLTTSGMGAVFAALRTDAHGLVDAYDPAVSVVPTSKLRFGDCGEPGCTVSVDVRPTAADESTGAVRVSMNVAFHGSARTVSKCSDDATARIGRKRTLSCRTGGRAWSSWYGSQTGRFTIHAGAVFSAGVNSASDVAALLGKLAREQRGD